MKRESMKTFQFNYYCTGEVSVQIHSFVKRIYFKTIEAEINNILRIF